MEMTGAKVKICMIYSGFCWGPLPGYDEESDRMAGHV